MDENKKLFYIPDGWVQVVPMQRTRVIHPTEIKVYDENRLVHYFVFVTDLNKFRVFDKVTGEFKRHRKARKQKMFSSMQEQIAAYKMESK